MQQFHPASCGTEISSGEFLNPIPKDGFLCELKSETCSFVHD
jgi:hypothetical protein